MAGVPGVGVLLFQGEPVPGQLQSDLWSFSRAGGWVQLASETLAGEDPGDAFAYDSDSKLVVFVQDREADGSEGSRTWTYDPASGEWSLLDTSGHPGNVWGSRIAYDAGSHRMILFGGFNGSATVNNQTWALDVETAAWTRWHPKTSPPARDFAMMAYDPEADRVILFGGNVSLHATSDDTWAYDYETDTWTELSPEVSPAARAYSGMVYDPVGKRMILAGGAHEGEPHDGFADTWAYDSRTNTWTNLHPATTPGPLGFHAMAYDPDAKVIVVFGGGPTRWDYTDETWIYDPAANTWTLLT